MKTKICIVVSPPMPLRTFPELHVAEFGEKYVVTVVTNFSNSAARLVGHGSDFVSIPIERRIAPLRDLAALAGQCAQRPARDRENRVFLLRCAVPRRRYP